MRKFKDTKGDWMVIRTLRTPCAMDAMLLNLYEHYKREVSLSEILANLAFDHYNEILKKKKLPELPAERVFKEE